MVSESDVCGPNSSLEFFVDGVVPECFMDVILFALNSAFIFIFGPVRIRQTLKSASQSMPTTPLYLLKLCSCLAGALIPMVHTIAVLVRGDPEAFRVVASLYITASWLMTLFVIMLEYSRAMRSNWVARVWGTSTFMLSGLALQSDVHLHRPGFDIFLSILFTIVSLLFGILVLFYNQLPAEYEKLGATKDDVGEGFGMEGVSGHTLLEEEEEDEDSKTTKRKPNPLSKANILSKATFQWLNPILRTGYKRPLEITDLFEPPSTYQTTTIARRFADIWEDLRIQGKQTLFRAFVRLVGWDFFVSGLFKLAQDILMFVGPVLLNRIVLFVKDPTIPQSTGFVLVGIMFAAAVLQTLFVHQYFYITFCVGMEVRAAIVAAVYRKSFFLSNKARQQSTVGEIVNLQSIDANKFQDLFPYLHMMWSAPFQLTVAMVMLWMLLGPSCLAGVAVMILTVPANGFIAKKLFGVQKIIMSLRDRRIKLMNEILNGMRIIKFFAWEDSFINSLNKIRNSELDTLRNTLWIRAVSTFLWGATPTLVALCTFALYSMLGNDLTAEIAFTSLALFNIIRFPMNMLPMIVNSVIESRVSLQRLSKFLLAEELDVNAVDVRPHESNTPVAISIREGSWTWDSSPNPTLQDISLDIPRGKLVAIVGQVGGGKSSLLAAILGEVTKLRGEVKLNGSTAYVAQQPWIQNATLRDNILFGTPFNQEKYDRVVQVCELTADINMLPNGDQTEIGEKGINLSGGQKQRLSVARAIYQNKDIYLLDDCLSAVDAHVGKAIFENAIMGELKSKTRVLVTHQLQFVWMADVIVVLKEGRISEMGSYDTLMKNQQEFHQLISTHVKKSDESSIVANQNKDAQAEHSNGSTKPAKEAEAATPASPGGRAPQGKLIQAEEREVGHVDSKVWLAYFAAIGGLFFAMLVMLCAAVETSVSVGASFWLSHWSASLSENEEDHSTAYYLGIYAALSLGSTFMVFGRAMMINIAGLNSSRTFHAMMLNTIMRAPMSFFDTTPIGRILNRFSKDVYAIDESLPRTLGMLVMMLFASSGVLLSIAFITPIFLIILLPLGYVYRFTQKFYLQSSREIQRLESITKSPVYAQFSETLSGVSTIRPYRRQDDFIAMNNAKVDLNISAYYILNSSNRWLGVRLEFIGTCIVTVAAAFAVIGRSSVDPGLAGLSITSALNLTGMLNWLVRMATETETQMVSVERARQYTQLPQEAPAVVEHNRPPPNWPTEGAVELKGVKLRYREGLELILKGISVSIKGKEKVGVVGRTGAGKSSLMLAIFRLVELAEGHIYVDGVDISQIGLKDLRSKLSIIPQDPTLYTGTVRSNLDPFDEHTDKEVWDSLQNVYLKASIEVLPEKLNAPVSEGGENFSVGQRQLLCLARAILRRAKIMVMDEATAAVDFETDALIQKTIREQFANVTVLTIAHRIHTIMDYDKILVLDKGMVAEFDSPANLLKNPNGIFYSMSHKSGTVDAEAQ